MNNKKQPSSVLHSYLSGSQRYRSKRRRRRQIFRLSLLCILFVTIVIGIIFLLKGCSERPGSAIGTDSYTESTFPDSVGTESDTSETKEIEQGFTTINIENTELCRGDLIVVRSGAEYVFPKSTENLMNMFAGRKKYPDGSRSYQLSSANLLLDSHVLSMLNSLTEEFYELTGENALLVASAYRSKEEQQSILDTRIEQKGEAEALKYVALPGESEHHTGLAFDMSVYKDGINTYIQDNEEYIWIYENAYRYGLILRYPEEKADITGINYESWHFRYVGRPHAYYMYKENLCLEEYTELLKTHFTASEKHLTIQESQDGVAEDVSQSVYEVYYVPASDGDTTSVIVPIGYDYSISGDNMEGFIITVKIK